MVKKVHIMTATYKNIYLPSTDARKVRGFFADLGYSDSNLHNHEENGDSIYRYPLVQYKVYQKRPLILALEEGIGSIHPLLMKQQQLTLGDKTYFDVALDIKLQMLPMGDSRNVRRYRFITPWLALNQENFAQYMKTDEAEKEKLLSRILIGNILSMCKSNGITVENQLQVTHHLKKVPALYKGNKMEAFSGSFEVNSCIPDLCGIGKGTARGFGTVKSEAKR